jgi:hypothetical protein
MDWTRVRDGRQFEDGVEASIQGQKIDDGDPIGRRASRLLIPQRG